ncbi:SURF4-domain-containing protein [Piromyces finnis]|uniref:SURF4-domain-containing protein n=1 Tax=Piromyces finnis TaxID=1754191 RepID=A0A1Y1V0T1_9FUNG|nr:SURF4-domain-containing protein [Piromyces finnis]|eukprot:ORX44717.1 SURF4-domain-containing protein [Piromyces finnis]
MATDLDEIYIKVKRYSKTLIPLIARILITSAFIQDSVDIYKTLEKPSFNILKIFWYIYQCNIILSSLICSILIICNKFIAPCTICLTTFSFISLIVYHNFTDTILITRRCSVLGGLLLLMAKGFDDKKKQFKIGLPDVPIISNSMYIQLAGRLMITFLFFTQLIGMNFKSHIFWSILTIILCAAAFVMIGIGYKVRIISPILCIGILIVNVFIYPWWEFADPKIERDVRFEFFQMLAIAGSLLLLAYEGAGELSVDEKKKNY